MPVFKTSPEGNVVCSRDQLHITPYVVVFPHKRGAGLGRAPEYTCVLLLSWQVPVLGNYKALAIAG